ncbi:MAG TPA: hypothetical protein EYP98_15505 [Planctomycetes bacterium]|nr:hypothetical protein [Planctomycetota bacterium]
MLLSDPSIQTLLRDDLVPCWESVQDTAKVTIAFADGKTLKRTIGGNTVIYLCRPDGCVVDAFPGVYTPKDFLLEAKLAVDLLQGNQAGMSDLALVAFHKNRPPRQDPNVKKSDGRSTTLSKRVVESPVRFGLLQPPRRIEVKAKTPKLAGTFNAHAPLRDVSKFPASSQQIRREFVAGEEREQLSPEAFGRRMVELDSMNNRSLVRPRVHEMLAASSRALTPGQWKHPMFEDLLDTDLSDPYLGLTDALLPGTSGVGR